MAAATTRPPYWQEVVSVVDLEVAELEAGEATKMAAAARAKAQAVAVAAAAAEAAAAGKAAEG